MEPKGQLLDNHTKATTKSYYEASIQPAKSVENKVEASFISEFESMVIRQIEQHNFSWECQTARQLRSIDSYEEFLNLLNDQDPNIRIFALDVIGRYGYLLSNQGQLNIRPMLHILLSDNTSNDYMYGGFQDEDESLSTVARMAKNALISLDCAANSQKPSIKDHKNIL